MNKNTGVRYADEKQPLLYWQIKKFNSRMIARIETPNTHFGKDNMKKIAVIIIAEKTAFQRFIYFILFSKLYRNGIIKEAIFKIRYKDILNFEIFERYEKHSKTFAVFFSQVFVMNFVAFSKSH